MRKFLLAPFIMALVLLLGACGGSDEANGDVGNDDDSGEKSLLEELQEKGTVKIGFANEEPYGYQNEDGEITGASVDTAKAVFKELGIDEVEGHLTDYDQLVSGLAADRKSVV